MPRALRIVSMIVVAAITSLALVLTFVALADAAVSAVHADELRSAPLPAAPPAAWTAWTPEASYRSDPMVNALDNDSGACGAGTLRRLTSTRSTPVVTATWVPCRSFGDAVILFPKLIELTGGTKVAAPHAWSSEQDIPLVGVVGDINVGRAWIQGRGIAILFVSCSGTDGSGCRNLELDYSRSVARTLPGDPAVDRLGSPTISKPITLGLSVWLLFVGPFRLFSLLRRQRFRSMSVPYLYLDLGGRLVRWRLLRWARLGATVIGGLASAMLAALLSEQRWAVALGAAALVVAAGLTVWQCRRREPRLRPIEITPRYRDPRFVVGLHLQAASRASAVTLAALVLVMVVAGFVTFLSLPELSVARERSVDGSFPGSVVKYSVLTVAMAEKRDSSWLLVCGLLLPLLVTWALSRFATRLEAPSLVQAIEHDDRPPFLLLRSFDEDSLRLQATWTRAGVLAKVTPIRRRRFEELVAAAFHDVGPVWAVSPPHTRLAPLGAARTTLPNEGWKESVETWLAESRAVVLSATPREIREGFQWELDLVSGHLGTRPVILVVGPHRRAEVRRRFGVFLQANASWASPLQFVPDGIHVAAFSPGRGWRAFGAGRRSDASYLLSIQECLQWLDPAFTSG